MQKKDDTVPWLATLILLGLTLWGGYSWGASSKNGIMSDLQSQNTSQSKTISDLKSQVANLKKEVSTTVPDKETLQYFAPEASTSCPVTTCSDGSCSESTGRGTCSWHGGVAY